MTDHTKALADALDALIDKSEPFCSVTRAAADALAAYRAALAQPAKTTDDLRREAFQDLALGGKTAHEFVLDALWEFQEATGCDSGEEFKAKQAAQSSTVGERERFEAYFLESRRNRGASKRPTFDRFPDGTYKDDHTQRHWWTWQQARATLATDAQAEPVAAPRIVRWGHCWTCNHDAIPGEGCARTECPMTKPAVQPKPAAQAEPVEPAAKITVHEDEVRFGVYRVTAELYAPGLPPGQYDVFLEPASVAFEAREIGEGDWFRVGLGEKERIASYIASPHMDYRWLYAGSKLQTAIQQDPAWQPIGTAPTDGTEILGWTQTFGALVLFWQEGRWSDGISEFDRDPIIWMPISAPSNPPAQGIASEPGAKEA